WKRKLPEGSSIIKSSYNKKHLQGTDKQTFEKFIIETKRAELTHWLLIPPAFVFFIWNPLWAGLVMVLYACVVNIPFILIQRYNRPRLERVHYIRKKKRV
ncbi:MAG: glycosyl-4,4'-diaponeurosporenoate acyltransferase, partial [Lactobacillales bacterium]|nr:glycosyl-4,4'-diaponeurosporenoate acyltransferase [Lactobacillales bacterium]